MYLIFGWIGLQTGQTMKTKLFKKHPLTSAVAFLSLTTVGGFSYAQTNQTGNVDIAPPAASPNIEIEEIVVTARLKDTTQAIIRERMEQAYSAEILGVEQITKAGDSNIASALRRVTGLTLVDGKFVYVRGLGERYSSTTLNGAAVPSPELTRNVIPLDLFPASILSSVKIHKAYSADQPATFGGGNIDIRTRGVPEQPLFEVSLGTGWDSNSGDDGINLQGDSGGLPRQIANAIQSYQGNVSDSGILPSVNTDGGVPSSAERAQADLINRQIMTSLDTSADFRESSNDPDFGGSISLGNSWFINDDISVGAIASYDVSTQVRNEDRIDREFANPEENTSETKRTVEQENVTKALNFGLTYRDKHFFTTSSFILENNEDQSAVSEGFDLNFAAEDGRQKLDYFSQIEKRELKINQIAGEHMFENGDFGFLPIPRPFEGVDVKWIYSDSTATTDLPNRVRVDAQNVIDPITLDILSTRLRGNSTSVAEYSFLELEDKQESGGVSFEAPFSTDSWVGTLSGGMLNSKKTREYYGYTANVGIGGVPIAVLTGMPHQVLTDSTLLNQNYDFELTMGADFGTESYIAAQKIDGAYGGIDATWNDTWRVSAGLRWEDFKQAVLTVDLLDFTGVTIQRQIEELEDPNTASTAVLAEDDFYPSLALTYLGTELFGSDSYQIRFGLGKTVVHPDLRERSDVQYLDPKTLYRMQGNPNLISADVNHVDLRLELFYPDGSNLTASLFYKKIDRPIETVERPASGEASQLFSFENGESAEIYGVEFEGFKELGAGLFLNSNLTLSDSETDLTNITGLTSPERPLTGHSDIVANVQLGFDSDDGLHSASVSYNYFSERVLVGSLNPTPDLYEEPFHSLDLVYSFFPAYNLSVKAKVKNLLGQDIEETQGSIAVREQEKGTSIGIDIKYDF